MIKQWYAELSLNQRLLALIISLLFTLALIKSAYYTIKFGGTDLRSRVVGARVLSTNYSPYFYTWQNGQSEKLLDPNVNKELPVNGVSVAPGILFFQSAFSFLPYKTIRIGWLIFQYALFFYIFIFAFRNAANNHITRLQIFAVTGILFCASPVWLYHIERGQVYILYSFIFFLLYQLIESKKPIAFFCAGLLLASAIYCRPPFAVVVPLLFTMNKQLFFGLLAGSIALTIHGLLHIQLWKEYFIAMNIYIHPSWQTITGATTTLPRIIEGTTNLTMYKPAFPCDGLLPLAIVLRNYSIELPDTVYLLLYFVAVLAFLFACGKTFFLTPKRLVLAGFVLYIMTEYFLPAPRSAYNLIQWMAPVLLLLQEVKSPPTRLVLLVTGLCFINNIPQYFPLMNGLGELLLMVAVMNPLNTKDVFQQEVW